MTIESAALTALIEARNLIQLHVEELERKLPQPPDDRTLILAAQIVGAKHLRMEIEDLMRRGPANAEARCVRCRREFMLATTGIRTPTGWLCRDCVDAGK